MHMINAKSTFNVKSIRLRLLLIMLILMVTSLSLLTGLSYFFANRALLESVDETASAIGVDYSNRVSAFVNNEVIFADALAVNPYVVNAANREQIVGVLADGLQRNPQFTGVNYGDLQGNMIRAQGDTAYLGDREYYQQAIRTQKTTISDPLVSRGSGRLSLAIAAPVVRNGEVVAVIQVTMPLDSLNDIVKEINFKDSGYGFILDQSGMLLAHARKPELNGRLNLMGQPGSAAADLAELDEQLIALFKRAVVSGAQIRGNYNTPNGEAFTVLTPINLQGGVRWYVAVSAPTAEVELEVVRLRTILILASCLCILLGAAAIVFVSTRFARPEEKYFKAFRHVADAVGIVNLHNEHFIEVNDAFHKIFGYDRDGVIGHTSEELGLWADEAGKRGMYDMLRRGVAIRNVEVRWHTKDNIFKTGLFSADGIKLDDEILAVFIWHDVTEQKQAEQALQEANEELERKVEERTRALFMANTDLTAMNEEMIAINDELGRANDCLHEENRLRRQTENKLLLRERQYRATTSLLTQPVDAVDVLAEEVLVDALQLVNATYGFIGTYNGHGNYFTIHHGIGIRDDLLKTRMLTEDVSLGELYKTGEALCSDDAGKYIKLPADSLKNNCMLLVPFKQNQQVKGTLAAIWAGEAKTLEEEDVAVLRQFADLALLAMERAYAQKKISHMAYYDALTGLPNRLSLNLRLEEEMKKARQGETEGFMFFIDMDDLKSVNDTLGHSAGDKVIVKAGKCLRGLFDEKSFVARISGDEFIVLVPGAVSPDKAAQLANEVLQQLCREYDLGQTRVQMSASIGVAFYPAHGDMPEELLKKADAAMYAAKEAGRNCWHLFEPALIEKTFDDMTLVNDLRRALSRKELFLQYQPQLTADGSRIVGFEALLRWKSPVHGFVSPARFIPLAEKSKLIVHIGQWVLQEACCFAKKMDAAGWRDIRVAVNISPRQLKDKYFLSSVRECIASSGIRPGQLEVEVTENVFMDALEESVRTFQQLQAEGVTLALDDFGTGFSSLTYLRNLPVNVLKIDKSFIDQIALDARQLQFVDSIINLGHTLGISIVAEGVETQTQLAELKRCGCDYVQGFVFYKPLHEQEVFALLKRQAEHSC